MTDQPTSPASPASSTPPARRIVLVRHGEAAAGWGEHDDPGLSERGHEHAEAMADRLAPLGPLSIVVSPLRRTRETAAPLERRWGVTARIEPRVGEIPSPIGDPDARMAWLRDLLTRPPGQWPHDLDAWRAAVVAALTELPHDTVVVTHFVAIRVASGLTDYLPDHCSLTVLEATARGLRLLERGDERTTVVR